MSESIDAWNKNAAAWESAMGDGNSFQRQLVFATQLELIGQHRSQLAIELACGTGTFIQELLKVASRVIAIDGSPEMLEHARTRTTDLEVELIELDLSDPTACSRLEGLSGDLVVCTMALMDIERLDVVAAVTDEVLESDGMFVCTVAHPAWFGPPPRVEKVHTYVNRGGEVVRESALRVNSYHNAETIWCRPDPSIPNPQPYYCRSIEDLLLPFLSRGLLIDRWVEPVFTDGDSIQRPIREDEWRSFAAFPPVLGLRMRKR